MPVPRSRPDAPCGVLGRRFGGGSVQSSTGKLNLVFVTSPDLAYQDAGDVNPSTANLTNQGLQRSLLLATYLKQQVLGGSNVTAIYTLQPMTHLQTPTITPTWQRLNSSSSLPFSTRSP